ncbi:MAG: hypothetical protein WA952_01575 [Lewinella sp.]
MRFTLFVLFLPFFLPAQISLFDELCVAGDTVLVEVETDWKKLLRNKHEKAYRDATFLIAGQSFEGRIRTRGHARLSACRFPSLKVKLKKKPLVNAGYNELNDLKFVLQCNSSRSGQAYLRRERLLYDLYAIVSPYSHRTLPVRWVLPDGDTLQGFFIEAEEQLEARLDAEVYKIERVSTRSVDRTAYLTLCLFNYMILNTDWNVFNLHNVECLRSRQDDRLIPVAYDFDYSGLVEAHYAVPREDLQMESIYEPRFLGRHVTQEELAAVAKRFLEHRDSLLQRVHDDHELADAYRERTLARLQDFFDELQDAGRLSKLASN